MKNSILFFGPYPQPITGQSISFKETYDNFKRNKLLFDTSRFGGNKILNSIDSILRIPFYFLFNKFDKVYFTCSRSFLGAIKDFVLLTISILTKKKIVCHLHGADFKEFYNNNFILKKIIKTLYQKIDTLIVLTRSMVDEFYFLDQSKIVVIENSYSLDYKNIIIDLENKQNQITFLSNIITSKGIFDLLDIAPSLLNYNSDLVIKIAGKFMTDNFNSSNVTKQLFFEKYNSLKDLYRNRISYLGLVTGIEKCNLLQESSIFILPTYYKTEAFPISIIEAMRFGNAIVTTKHNYLPDIITNSNGFIVSKKNTKELFDFTNKLINDKKNLIDIQKNNIKIAEKKYSPEIYLTKINQVLES